MGPQCNWCHEPVNVEMERHIGLLLKSFGGHRERYIRETWGALPTMLCAKDFLVLFGQTNNATWIGNPSPL